MMRYSCEEWSNRGECEIEVHKIVGALKTN